MPNFLSANISVVRAARGNLMARVMKAIPIPGGLPVHVGLSPTDDTLYATNEGGSLLAIPLR